MNCSLRWTLGLTIVWASVLLPNTWGLGAPPAYRPALAALEPGVPPWDAYAEPSQPRRLPEVDAAPLGMPIEAPAPAPEARQMAAFAPPPQLPDPAPNDVEYFTMDELRGEMKELAWTKGDFKIVPYGILWFNMAYETQRSYVGDFTYYVFSPDDHPGDACHVNARSTRLGFNLSGPRVPCLRCAPSGGKVEIDFWGQFTGGENKPGILLRHAYWEVKDDTFRLLAGQTWDVMSPLYPGTLMYTVGWGGGNIGYRRAQLRYERYLAFSNTCMLTLEGALAADLVSEMSANMGGDHAGWPVLEGRAGMTLGPRGKGCRPITFGVSGHIGEQEFLFDSPDPTDDEISRTWSFNVDVRVPITDRFGVQGEFFTGENLGTYQGGVLQGVNTVTAEPIRATGGWVDLWYDWTPLLHSHVGYGIDDPVDRDVTDGRIYNHFVFANISYDLTKDFLVGFEYMSWKTLYDQRADGTSDQFHFAAKYAF
ncbi:MAG TPA: hypothetical protein VMY37_32670 [Thermoguttaceae bacterium]|nr:hypothetical protein [Thermoguttaceae bacterium]